MWIHTIQLAGKVGTRTSKSHRYEACVVVSSDERGEGVFSWHHTLAAAKKGLLRAQQSSWPHAVIRTDIQVVEK